MATSDLQLALRAFLLSAYDLPFVWGERDCALWVCDWIKERRGVDPGEQFRGRYKTKLGCARLLARNGGLLNLATNAFRDSGMLVTGHDAPGDVGCIQAPAGETLGIAVNGSNRWAMFGHQAVTVSSQLPVLRVWKV